MILKEDLTALGLRLGAIAIFCATPFQPSREIRLAGWSISASCIVAAATIESCEQKRWYFRAADRLLYSHWLATLKKQLTTGEIQNAAEPEREPTPFRWERFRESPAAFPHIMIAGPTGTGKTVFAEYLLDLLPGTARVVTPKRTKSQWRGLFVIGTPRNFGEIERALDSYVDKMTDRIADLDADHEQINLAIDELPACRKNIENFCDLISTLLCEAREAKIRVIALSQSTRVEPLGLKGQGDVVDCLCIVRLGKFALDYAQELANKKRLSKTEFEWLRSQQRPAMVGDEIATIPNLSGWKPTKNRSEDASTNRPAEISDFGTERKPKKTESSISESITALGIPADELIKVDPYRAGDIETWEFEQVRSLHDAGAKLGEICKLIYDAKSGDRYQAAMKRVRIILGLEFKD